jgi:PAS domain S-box-containing protein
MMMTAGMGETPSAPRAERSALRVSAPPAVTAAARVDAGRPWQRRHRQQWAMLLLGLVLVAATLAAALQERRAEIGADHELRLRQQLRLLDQQLTRQINAVDAGLQGVLADLPAWTSRGDWASVGLRLKALDNAVTGTRTIILLDASGRVVASSRPELLGVDASARPFFQAMRRVHDPGGRLFVSAPYRTQLGVWAINASRAVIGADGRFAGAVTATLDPEWLEVTLGTANYAPDMWAALAHGDGRLVQMVPQPQQLPVDGVDLAQPGTMFMRHRAAATEETVFSGRFMATAQPDRLIAQRTLLPSAAQEDTLVLALSRDLGAVHAGWRQQAVAAGAFAVLLAALAVTGLALAQRGERREAAAEAAARLAVQAQERRWALALASMELGVWDRDLRSGREYRSEQWQHLLGLTAAAVSELPSTWQALLHPDDAAAVTQRLREHLDGRSDAFEARCRLRAGDGQWRSVRIGGLVVERDDGGTALRIVGTLLDETDRVQAEALRLQRDRAEAANQAKSEFMSRMSHEMRTPLNAVLGFAQLLKMRVGQADAEEQRQQLDLIEQGGRHLLELVEDVLDLSRIERGHLELDLKRLPLAPVLAQAVALVTPLAQQVGLTLRLDAPPADAAEVRADALRLKQVLHNLLGNAIKYNRPGGTVDVRWRAAPAPEGAAATPGQPGWCIEVQDSGPGLSPEQQAHLFEPFNRLGQAQSSVPGTGLGLVLSRWFVEHMGGRIAVDSAPGAGSTFAVWLPAA